MIKSFKIRRKFKIIYHKQILSENLVRFKHFSISFFLYLSSVIFTELYSGFELKLEVQLL